MACPLARLEMDLSLTSTRETVLFTGAFPARENLEAFQVEIGEEAPETHIEIFLSRQTAFAVSL